jgi:cation transport protein ChaC
MWSHVNRGTPQCPGLVFGMLPGGSCHGVVFRVREAQGEPVLRTLWQREMPVAVYDPRWLPCHTPQGPVQALAFTLSRRSPHYTGTLPMEQYRRIFAQAQGRYGSTQDYALDTYEGLRAVGIHDRALRRLIESAQDSQGDTPTAQSGA